MKRVSTENLEEVFTALAAFLEQADAPAESLVVIGGAAMIALGFVSRTTRDVDIMAGVDVERGMVDPRPMSAALRAAADAVAREMDLEPNWLNTGPADQLMAGLPEGFLDRLARRNYGTGLAIYYPDRLDLIHLKLFAVVDQGLGRHSRDLEALAPSDEELVLAGRWVLTQDAGEVFPQIVAETLGKLGHGHLVERI